MNPRILITGASSGIGAACARHFAAAGWEVLGTSRRGGPWIACDLTTEAGIAAAAAAAAADSRPLEALVHSAGEFLAASIERTPPEEFERIWRITVWARHALTRALLPQLTPPAGAPTRAVIHISSLAAHRDFPDETAYTSAMHAAIGLARAQDAELRARGIRAAVVSPGMVRTPLTERAFGAAALVGALEPEAIAASVSRLVGVIRSGGYIPEILHVPQNST